MDGDIFVRHYPVIGREGQEKLSRYSVVVVGAGALGSYTVHFLKKLGVGKIRVIDGDTLNHSDIPRTLYNKEDVGRLKVELLSEKYDVEGIAETLISDSIHLLDNFDLIMDATDNIHTRYLINEFADKRGIPWVHMAVLRTYGYIMGIIPGKTACYRCLIPRNISSVSTCAIEGIMSYVPATAAAIGVAVGQRILLEKDIKSEMIYFNLENMEFQKIFVPRKDDCEVCVRKIYKYLEKGEGIKIREVCEGVEIIPPEKLNIDLDSIKERLEKLNYRVYGGDRYIKFHEGDIQIIIFKTGKMLVKGVDKEEAMRYYARYLGY